MRILPAVQAYFFWGGVDLPLMVDFTGKCVGNMSSYTGLVMISNGILMLLLALQLALTKRVSLLARIQGIFFFAAVRTMKSQPLALTSESMYGI